MAKRTLIVEKELWEEEYYFMTYKCPNAKCDCSSLSIDFKYCHDCGYKLDWSNFKNKE